MTFDRTARTPLSLRRHLQTLGLLFSAACLGTLLSGCGGNSAATATSRIRTLNAYVPAAGTDGSMNIATTSGLPLTAVGTPLGFGQFAGGGAYATVTSGSITITATGTNLATPLSLTSTFSGNNAAYTLVAAGQAGQTGVLVPQLLAVPNFVAGQLLIPSGDAAIRVVNLSLDTNPIGLYNTTSGVPSGVVSPTVSSVAYGYSAANAYVSVPTTQLTSLAVVDTSTPATALSLSTSSNLNTSAFTTGQAYTLYVYGQQGNATQPLTATWVEDYP